MYSRLQRQTVDKYLSHSLCDDCLPVVEEYLMGHNHTRDIFDSSVEWETPTQKLLALVMAYNADRRGVIRLTQQEIGDQALISRQRVATLIDDLCEREVLKRLKHGRYGLRFGLPRQEEDDVAPAPKGAKEETERIMAIVESEKAEGNQVHGIAFNADGWPVMVEVRAYLESHQS